MKATPSRLKAVVTLFMVGTFLGLGLCIFNLTQAKFAGALLALGFAFSMMAAAVNPRLIFTNNEKIGGDVSQKAKQTLGPNSGVTDDASKKAHQLNLLMAVCYIASLSIFLVGKFIA